MKDKKIIERRDFLKNVALLSVTGGISLASVPLQEKEEGNVTPPEDLMREHGLLSRILLIYDTCRLRLTNNEDFDTSILNDSAGIIRSFVEDYHEKLEENFLFPAFMKANKLTDLVNVLKKQHDAGRKLTDPMLKLGKSLSPEQKKDVIRNLDDFNKMYRPHKSREDTVLFPAIREIFSQKEFLDLGEKFEDREKELFGEKGFESMVSKVENLEKKLNIFDLNQFTPRT
jgi:hemerythrin-like domain-containing protein